MGTPDRENETHAPEPLVGLTTAPGSGLLCDECHLPIGPNQVECRCAAGDHPLHFHQWCYYVRTMGTT